MFRFLVSTACVFFLICCDNANTSTKVDGAFQLGEVVFKIATAEGALKKHLVPDECVVQKKIGKYWNKSVLDRPDGVVFITNYRFVFLARVKSITATTNFISIPFNEIARVRKKTVMGMSPAVEIASSKGIQTFTLFSGANEMAQTIQLAVDGKSVVTCA